MDCIFCSRDPQFKRPFGAATNGAPIEFNVFLDAQYGAATLHIRSDDGGYRRSVEMRREQNGDKTVFSATHIYEQPGLYFYNFELPQNGEFISRGDGGVGYLSGAPEWEFQQTIYSRDYRAPAKFAGGVMYQIFPDRFNIGGSGVNETPYADRVIHADVHEQPVFRPDENGVIRNNDYFGGNLRGIEDKLAYLKELGVTCIYLNPVFESHSNHRYDTADYMKIDPLLGTEDDFKRLCTRAKEHEIDVILDGVFSHTGDDSVYFDRNDRYDSNGAWKNPESPYRSWYKWSEDGESYWGWWGFDTLPEVNENDPSFVDYICGENGVIDHWMRCGAAGFRLDVADELPDDFIEKIRARIKAHGDDKMLLGEVWEDASNKMSYGARRRYLWGNELDSVMNYPFKNAILDFVENPDGPLFFERVMTIVENYPKPMLDLMMNLLSTHDTPRAITMLAGDCAGDREYQSKQLLRDADYLRGVEMFKLATVLQFTLPGLPSVYYGDEVGMQGCGDPFNRAYFYWDNIDENLLHFVKEISAVRHAMPAFKDGSFVPLESGDGCVSFLRKNAKQTVFVMLNRGDAEITRTAPGGRSFTAEPWRWVIEEI